MKNSHIAWTDDTYNPIIVEGGGFYCVKVSEGCKYCYAETVNRRFGGESAHEYKVMNPFPKMKLREDMLAGWARKKKPRKNFVSSMTDVFGEFVPDEWIYKILDAMIAAPLQIFQVLTKRDVRMREVVDAYCQLRGLCVLPQNIWCIVSVENQQSVKRAINLIATRCTIRGLSIEPLLGAINLSIPSQINKMEYKKVEGEWTFLDRMIVNGSVIEHIDWVIVGGESGIQARPMNPNWVYDLKKQCDHHKVPFFFKQWGEWVGAAMDMQRGKVMIEDGGIFYTNPGHPKIHDWKEVTMSGIHRSVSTRVGKKSRTLHWMSEPNETLSDNALLGGFAYGKHFFNFPKYLTENAQ